MATAVRKRSAHVPPTRSMPVPPKRITLLLEDIVRSGKLRVDKEAGIIHGVKILGRSSTNNRRYLPEAIRAAIPLYEGRSVCIDHPDKPAGSRKSEDVFGRLVHVREEGGELFGDLEFLKAHPMASVICEAAERMPEVFGLSHNAQGDTERDRDGLEIVHRIIEVRSVDVVAEPATTNGFFESEGNMAKINVKKFLLETVLPKFAAAKQPILKTFLESAAVSEMYEMDTPDAAGEPEDHLWQGFRSAMMAILDGDGTAEEKASKLKSYLQAHEKLSAKEAEGDVTEENEDPDKGDYGEGAGKGATAKGDKEQAADRKKMESRMRELERKDKARDLCEVAKIVPDKVLLEALLSAKDEAAMARLIEREKTTRPKSGPRSSATGDGSSLTEGRQIDLSTPAAQIAFTRG